MSFPLVKIMPRPSLPPTPQPSTDITGKSSATAPPLDSGFVLPPAALGSRASVASSSDLSENASDSSYRPLSPSSPIAVSQPGPTRKRSHSSIQQGVVTKDDYSLPPPPTRSRKIIQMKPKDSQEAPKQQSRAQAAKATTSNTNGTKKKQASNSTVAGRKIARKTAHSLIERRRRSKMNEEFGVLKDMIPACRGQEMHKLAILQASIEYMRYLEQCVSDLKNAQQPQRHSPSPAATEPSPPPALQHVPDDKDKDDDDENEDEEMEGDDSPAYVERVPPKSERANIDISPMIYPSDRSAYAHSTTTSPTIMPHDRSHYSANPSPALRPSDPHHYALSSTSTRSTAAPLSAQSSPAFKALTPSATLFSTPFGTRHPSVSSAIAPGSSHGSAPFVLTSPALGPQVDREDQEATEALMMLNTDRRKWSMSVKDLLSG